MSGYKFWLEILKRRVHMEDNIKIDAITLHIDGLTIKFANVPCACRGSSGQKPQYGLMTLAYQVYCLEVLKRLREKLYGNDPNFCQQLMDLAS
jgi:hypothetical protein